MFYKAYKTFFKLKTILKAFKVTSLSLFNPQKVLKRFNIEEQERPSLSESTILVLSALDQRKIKRLLRKVVTNIYDAQARQLS